MKRRSMSKKESKGKFKRSAGIHKLNKVNKAIFRGGIRL